MRRRIVGWTDDRRRDPAVADALLRRRGGQVSAGPDGWAYLAAINNVETDFGQNISTSSAGAVGLDAVRAGHLGARMGSRHLELRHLWAGGVERPWRRDLLGRQLLAGVRGAGRLGRRDLHLQPRGLVREQGGGDRRAVHRHGGEGGGSGHRRDRDWSARDRHDAGRGRAAPEPGETTGAGAAGTGARARRGGQGTAAGTATPAPGDTGGSVGCGVTGKSIPGQTAKIEANGTADVPADAPLQVQLAIAAGNRIIDTYYSRSGDRASDAGPGPCMTAPASTDFVLYNSAARNTPLVTVGGRRLRRLHADLETFGNPGPGQWITVYADGGHAFIEVAGIVLDTSHYAPVQPARSLTRFPPTT